MSSLSTQKFPTISRFAMACERPFSNAHELYDLWRYGSRSTADPPQIPQKKEKDRQQEITQNHLFCARAFTPQNMYVALSLSLA